ncbi:hypothetical protein CK203_069314 [Vitis vinifera]|uniref:Uncharacterized protein n=1 Tax=Vitis vinifera TaxID=29760 RepID=A0A438BZX0_VITVI|nr:hypothetical protein CK203_069314 [Vitis vinifera]
MSNGAVSDLKRQLSQSRMPFAMALKIGVHGRAQRNCGLRNLIPVFMAEKSCSVSSLPWLWLQKSQIIWGRNVKEMIALRCLEALFSGITNDVHPVVHSKMGFDPSESCEDVLQCILRVSIKLRMGEPELLKWNVNPFIAHKRACLPKCALQELKDTILEGSHPSAVSLKERSGLRFESQCETRTPNGDGDSGAVAPRVDEGTACGQVEAAKGDLIPLTAENENNLLPEDTTERDFIAL